MKSPFRFALLGAALLLSGCGSVVGSFIGPQHFETGLTGKTLTSSALVRPADVKGTLAYNTSGSDTFEDVSVDNHGIVPREMLVKLSLTRATVNPECLAAPDQFDVAVSNVTFKLSDAHGSVTVTNAGAVTLTLSKSGGVYTIAANSFSLNASADQARAAFSIATSGGTNTVRASADISSPADALAGCTLTFTLGDTSGTFQNFGN